MNIKCEGRVKVLFLKLLRKEMNRWKKVLKNIVLAFTDDPTL